MDADFVLVRTAFRDSIAYRIARGTIARVTVAMSESALCARARTVTAPFTQLAPERRLSYAAGTLAWASIAHLAMRSLLPPYASSGLPWWWNVAVAIFALVLAVNAPAVSSAWPDSTPAKVWRRFAS